ncbi:PKD domain-containing protein [bacterium]|nr:PKD domain-containing protein [bacterium]
MPGLTHSCRTRAAALAAALLCAAVLPGLLSACAGSAQPSYEPAAAVAGLTPAPAPSNAELQQALQAEFERLGIDPRAVSAAAPGPGSEVFDLALEPVYDEDGATVIAIRLAWTERMLGDYDGNGRVSASDLTPIGLNFRASVAYDPAESHGGIAWWPAGNPADGGAAASDEPATAGSAARNWALARIDGDANGQISISDLTVLATNWQARLDSYRIYRRGPGETDFTLLPDPSDNTRPFSISRASAANAMPLYPDPSRPLRYSFEDPIETQGEYEYLVAPYDSQSQTEGPLSITAGGSLNVQASFTADRLGGTPPLVVNFDASASTVTEGQIAEYRWDFNNDGETDSISVLPQASELFEEIGAYVVVLRVVSTQGDIGIASRLITVGETPELQLKAEPAGGEVPLILQLTAQASSQTGVISKYEWDLDGDGSYELSTGPVPVYSLAVSSPGSRSIGVRVSDEVGISATAAQLLLFTDDFDEIEPNDAPEQGSAVPQLDMNGSLAPQRGSLGQLSYDGDSTDWYRLQLGSAGVLELSLESLDEASDLDLALYNASGGKLLGQAAGSTIDEALSLGIRSPGAYTLKVSRKLGPGSDDAHYLISGSLTPLVYDETENNDNADQADDLGVFSGAVLPGYWGSLGAGGPDGDDNDWYRITLNADASLGVLLAFSHLDADLELQLYDSDKQTVLAESRTVQDDESLIAELPPGQYYIRCFRFDGTGANYTLGLFTQ